MKLRTMINFRIYHITQPAIHHTKQIWPLKNKVIILKICNIHMEFYWNQERYSYGNNSYLKSRGLKICQQQKEIVLNFPHKNNKQTKSKKP